MSLDEPEKAAVHLVLFGCDRSPIHLHEPMVATPGENIEAICISCEQRFRFSVDEVKNMVQGWPLRP